MNKKLKSLCSILCCASILAGCGGGGSNGNFKRGLDDYSFTKASISATDRENRKVTPMQQKKTDKMRYVGVFYWLWEGNNDHQFGVYDNTKLMATEEGRKALFQTTNPPGDGMPNASPIDFMHWTNEPMLGYYNMSDPWVITRHIEMLTMADIDFIFLDTTNYYDYHINYSQHPEASEIKGSGIALLDTMLEYYNQGWDIPKVAFYTNSCSGDRVKDIYNNYYKSGKYEDLWFKPNGKPLIIGTTENNGGGSDMNPSNPAQYNNISAVYQEYFEVKESQWPTRKPTDVGFPWMDWAYPQSYHSVSKTVNVSVSQHSNTKVLYNLMDPESSKGYDARTKTIEENWAAGRNFENGWETVFKYEEEGKDIEYVTVCGWNEWVVQKSYMPAYADPVRNPNGMAMVDNFDAEYSRDIEPDKTYYKDNVYMQLVRNVRRLKYDALNSGMSIEWGNRTIKSISDFDKVAAVYKDFENDARERDFYGYDIRKKSKENNLLGAWYTDKTNYNDIIETRVTHDGSYVYFGIKTKEDVKPYKGEDNWMNVLIKTSASTANNSFEGYDFIINRTPDGGLTTVEKSTGGWNWEKVGDAELTAEGNMLMLKVPLSALGLDKNSVYFEFKVADNVVKPNWFEESDPDHEVLHYYITGDSAPIGRLNYTYGYKGEV